jgi:DNA-directed RNA polymerase subunit omega
MGRKEFLKAGGRLMDIISLPAEYDKGKIDSRFRLVVIAAQRARELAFGAKPKLETKYRKVALIALEEAIENQLEFSVGEEARAKIEESRKFDYKRFLEERRRQAQPEDLSELEKDLRVYLHEKEGGADRRSLEELFGEKQEEGEAEKPE